MTVIAEKGTLYILALSVDDSCGTREELSPLVMTEGETGLSAIFSM
jgi:hypothetical protein